MATHNSYGKRHAGSVRRIVAYAIDVGFLSSVLLIPQFAINYLTGFTPASFFNLSSGLYAYVWVLLTVSLPSWFYFAASDYSARGAALGKRIIGLRVADTNGDRIGLGRAILRTLIKIVPWELTHILFFLPFLTAGQSAALGPEIIMPYVLVAIYGAIMLRTHGKQSIHDLVAGTVVISS